MKREIAVEIDHLGKMYQIYDRPKDRLKQSLFMGRKKFYRDFWALRDVHFQVLKGQTVGILGHNGSGKSTLLQIIAGTMMPTQGFVRVHGRVAALLELGSGFNPEMTGRENALMNGVILGLSQEEMQERMPLIEKFAEIGEFMDHPVKMYSSGMFVRLAFACAVNVDPDILIVDEALAVGDMKFQLKCIDKMEAFKRAGKTILFVSHDAYTLKNFCNPAVWLKEGQVHLRGDVNSVTYEYEEFMKAGRECEAETELAEEAAVQEKRKDVLTIEKVFFSSGDGRRKKDFSFGEAVTVTVEYVLHEELAGVVGGIAIYDKNNSYVCGLNTKLDEYALPSKPGRYQLTLDYESVQLLPGTYFVDIGFYESSAIVNLDYKSRFDYFRVASEGTYFAEGLIYLQHQWKCLSGR